MKKIMLLGGCGYIGSSLFLYLQSKKYRVTTIDLEWFGNVINPKNQKKNFNDITKTYIKKFDVIILLAGYSSVQMCMNNMSKSFENNVMYFINLLKKIDKQKFIYASSSSIYGNTNQLLVTEDYDRYTPNNYYDLTKKEIDYYAHLSNINYFGLRLGTVNGYSPNLRSDLMINKMVRIAQKTKKIHIFNAQSFRPILGMQDACHAIETIIEHNGTPGIYNIASFNDTIIHIGKKVAEEIPQTEVIVDKKKTPYTYNFSISTKKFEKEFHFTFKDTVATIVQSLQNNKPHHIAVRGTL